MSDTVSNDPSDRLPWLADTPVRQVQTTPPKRAATMSRSHGLAGWAVAGLLAVAGMSYWFGMQTGQAPFRPASVGPVEQRQPSQPDPFMTGEPQVPLAEAPEVRPSPVPVVTMPGLDAPRRAHPNKRVRLTREVPPSAMLDETVKAQSADDAEAAKTSDKAAAASDTDKKVEAASPKLWPSRVEKGAAGRLVQIGAFGSTQQAKLGWRKMQREYPAVGKLPAVVVESRNSAGRKFYRFQIGTTSQAHSEVLCQRMQKIDFSCAVMGLPWKSKVER